MRRVVTHSVEETKNVAKELAGMIKPGMLLAFQGELGAGKTTFIQGLLEGFDAKPPFPSPTFVLMNQYELPERTVSGVKRIYHADAYRVGADDFEKLGFAEWLADKEGVIFLEWSERLRALLPEHYTEISLETLSDGTHSISIDEK